MTIPQKPIIYQLVVRYFGNTNLTNKTDGTIDVNGCGKFADIDDAALKSLRAMGVTHVWLTGVPRQATLTAYDSLGMPADCPNIVKGLAGSFYAVKDYFDVCPDYAVDPGRRMAEFEDLIGRVHAAGLKALIDFVPNHVSRAYSSTVRPDWTFGAFDDQSVFFSPTNHFFYLVDPPGALRLPMPNWHPEGVEFDGVFEPEDGSPGHTPKASGDAITQAPPVTSWYEVVKLNYGFNPADQTGHYDPMPPVWNVVDEILGFWQSKGVDGFRCDMAHLIPAEAWRHLIGRARSAERDPDAYFLAEAYPRPDGDEPVKDRDALIDAGFDALYHADSFHCLRHVYKGWEGPDDYQRVMGALSARERDFSAQYLENHDESRVAAAVEDNGCGSMAANYHVAPLQFLYSRGPILMLNGQEIGEPGGGCEGFHQTRGRSTFFDYWCMPEFAKWVNGHAYDGGLLSAEQKRLRAYFGDLLALCQDPAVRGEGYWGLRYHNRHDRFADCPDSIYTFARFEPGSGRLILVASNFGEACDAVVRLPQELIEAAGLPGDVRVRLLLDQCGRRDAAAFDIPSRSLAITGIPMNIVGRSTSIYAVEGT